MASVIICQPWMWGEEIEKKKKKITWNCQFVLRIFEAIYEMQGELFGIQDLYVFSRLSACECGGKK